MGKKKTKSGFTKVPGGVAGQDVSDVKEGIKQGMKESGEPDYSRISSYHGEDKGVHTGSETPTKARHGGIFKKLFGKKK